MSTTTYTVSDGNLMLILEPAEEGGYNVTSPLDPQLITQAETLEEAFANAYDAREALIQARAEMADAFLVASSTKFQDKVASKDNTASPESPVAQQYVEPERPFRASQRVIRDLPAPADKP